MNQRAFMSITRSLSILMFFIAVSAYSQVRLTVTDGLNPGDPLEEVIVLTANYSQLGKTDARGVFMIPAGINRITLLKSGYLENKIDVTGSDMKVELQPILVELEETEISGDDSEARNIIRTAIKNRKKNNIENLKSFEYKSYTKFLVTASTDSMPYILFPKNKKDSSYNDVRRLLDKSHLMLGERAMDHKFSEDFGKKNIVKATRVSGTKLPMYEFAAMEPISENFDNEKIKLFFREFANPISNEGLKEYRYRISTDEDIEGREMIVIAFFPKKRAPEARKIKGYVWIEKETYAIAKFYGESVSDKRVAELDMDWTRFNNYWFPKQQRFMMDGGYISYPDVKDSVAADGTVILDTIKKREKVWLHLTRTFEDILSPVDFNKKEFRGYENEIDAISMENPEEVLESYRIEPLTEKEMITYEKIDSVGQKYNMDRSLRMLRVLSSGGKYPVGKFDVDITKLINYNNYEGFRLGLGGNTNHKFNENISLNGYAAYGFKDKKMKFGGGVDWFVNKAYSGRAFLSYAQDVEASGKSELPLQSGFTKFISNSLSNIYNDFFYSYKRVSGGYEQDIFQNLAFRISGIYNEKTAEFEYRYLNNRPDEKFLSFDTELTLRWAPKDKYVRTPYGKVTLSTGMPVFYLTFSKGINLFNADYTPTKIDFAYFDNYRTFLGRTNFHFRTGAVFGETPIMNMFEGMGNATHGDDVLKRFGLAGSYNFETMLPGEFYSDKYAMFHITQRFFGFKFLNKQIFPEFIYRGLIGDMKNPEDHQFIDFKVPKKYYQEVGLELNNLLLGSFGIGAYYRLGDYSHNSFKQDFFVKLTYKFRFF